MKTKRLLYLSMIVSIGIALHIIESTIPLPFIAPGAKLGLANIVNLITLVVFGYKYAFAVAIIRCLVATLGTGAVTGLLYSLSGALLSTLVMWVVYRNFSTHFSLIGVSVFGALAHNIAQLAVASIMIHNILIFTYLPVMMLVSLFTGYFVGLTSNYATLHLKAILSKGGNTSKIIM
ncbi:heptaprenyl diphosphate synthase [Anaerosolibacter carboniphilus]|uniref:Heptaprenyl diphosphate synthase n=1 Tax=Anaerosolibacter carboniphilus TaxID=1417629 RepID=A0A841KXM7_9FIRM|nr:Gx transporter family protein [Anaerosolibacter carboniphilus]MBB6214905.1 heptaprenyl diphosphate synthase [Anaerosolibacter carboniphilus]